MMKKCGLKFLMIITMVCSLLTIPANAGRYRASDVMMVATVIWHEAHGEGYAEMQKVANVIMNRFEKFEGNNKGGYKLEIGDILTARDAFENSTSYLRANMTNDKILQKINRNEKT